MRLLQGGDVLRAEAPVGEALLPRGRGVGGRGLHVLPVAPRGLGVDPRLEGGGVEPVEEQQQVREVALRVDRDHRHALAQQLLEEDDGEARLARAGHADDEAVGQEVGGVEVEARAEGPGSGVDLLSEIEPVGHPCLPAPLSAQYSRGASGRRGVLPGGRRPSRPVRQALVPARLPGNPDAARPLLQ